MTPSGTRAGIAIVLLAVACSSTTTTTARPGDAGTTNDAASGSDVSTPKKPTAGVIAIGSTSLLYRTDCDNVKLTKALLQALAGRERDIAILYTEINGCDPRTTPGNCA